MLTILLKILSIIGIILLVLLGIVLAVLLLVLFLPIVYRVRASLPTSVRVKINWFFGLIRVRYLYPEPGNLTVKILWFTLFDTAGESRAGRKVPKRAVPGKTKNAKKTVPGESENAAETVSDKTENAAETISGRQENSAETIPGKQETVISGAVDMAVQKSPSFFEKIENFKEKLQSGWDKVQNLGENINYYKDIATREDTKGLLAHGLRRLGKILKSIRPRRLKADLILGTGAPDTTGYVFAAYGMVLPYLGKYAILTPDFEEKRLEGEIDVAGHITIFQVVWNGLMVVFDKRLRKLIPLVKKAKR